MEFLSSFLFTAAAVGAYFALSRRPKWQRLLAAFVAGVVVAGIWAAIKPQVMLHLAPDEAWRSARTRVLADLPALENLLLNDPALDARFRDEVMAIVKDRSLSETQRTEKFSEAGIRVFAGFRNAAARGQGSFLITYLDNYLALQSRLRERAPLVCADLANSRMNVNRLDAAEKALFNRIIEILAAAAKQPDPGARILSDQEWEPIFKRAVADWPEERLQRLYNIDSLRGLDLCNIEIAFVEAMKALPAKDQVSFVRMLLMQ